MSRIVRSIPNVTRALALRANPASRISCAGQRVALAQFYSSRGPVKTKTSSPVSTEETFGMMIDRFTPRVEKLLDRVFTLIEQLVEYVFASPQVTHTAEGFQVKLNIDGYKPEEVRVYVEGQQLVITRESTVNSFEVINGKETYKTTSTSSFSTPVLIPEDVDIGTMEHRFTDDGYLVVTAKVKDSRE